MGLQTITAANLLALRSEGKPLEIIDVRTPVEFRELHVEGACSVPLDRLDPPTVIGGRNGDSPEPLYVICQSGSRAKQACEKFASAGFPNVVLVEDGTPAWQQAGGPVVRGKKAVSLERQVRIVAGFLVLLGAGLALTIDLWFILLSAFIGAGLMFEGITDTCGMGMLLARMPWNQVSDGDPSACTR